MILGGLNMLKGNDLLLPSNVEWFLVNNDSAILRLIVLRWVFTILARSKPHEWPIADQQQLNVVFDYGNLLDVLLILMSVLVLFRQYNTENSNHKEFYRLHYTSTGIYTHRRSVVEANVAIAYPVFGHAVELWG